MAEKNRKIKVCWATNIDKSVKFVLFSYLKFLKSEGFDVHVACSDGDFVEEIRREGIKVKTIEVKRKITPFYDIVTFFNFWNYFRKERFDIVHAHTPKVGVLAQIAAKLAGVPIIVNTVHGYYFQKNDPPLRRRIFIFLERIAAKCSSVIFFVNREDMQTALDEKICRKKIMRYFGGGIDLSRFNPGAFTEESILEKKSGLKIASNKKIIGIVARLVEEKGYMDLFKAFKYIASKYPDVLLMVIGPQEPEKKDRIDLADAVKRYGIAEKVLYLGERSDINELFLLMDVFVLPSYREGLGISLLEAQAMERPVVATNIRGCREAVENGKTGILVPKKQPQELAKAVMRILSDGNLAKEMGKMGRKRAAKEFDERLVFDRIEKEYNRLIKNKLKNVSTGFEKDF